MNLGCRPIFAIAAWREVRGDRSRRADQPGCSQALARNGEWQVWRFTFSDQGPSMYPFHIEQVRRFNRPVIQGVGALYDGCFISARAARSARRV